MLSKMVQSTLVVNVSTVDEDYLTQQKSTLAMVDDDYAILKLRGQVKRETGPGKTRMAWRNLHHHVIHNVLTII